MVNIQLSILGGLCFIIPFIQYKIYKDKVWCKYYCPRAGLFVKLLGKVGLKRKMPKFMTSKKLKRGIVIYFAVNVFFAIMSTIMVLIGRIPPIDHVRFLILFKAPFDLPQFIDYNLSLPLIHLGYRIYSIMLTSTIIGTILGFIYSPRTWCVICPVSTLTTKSSKS